MSDPRTYRLPTAVLVGAGILLLALAALLVYAVVRSGNDDRDALPSALIGKPAPEFALPLLHDPSIIVHARELRGAPYIINVWGSWCPACREEHPVLSRFALTKRVRVIGYNWKDERADALRWLEQLGNPYLLVSPTPMAAPRSTSALPPHRKPSWSTAAAWCAGSTAAC